MRRLNKEYKLDICDNVIVKYGSVNRDNPQVVYVSGRCWVMPKSEMDYEYVISNIEKEMKKDIKFFFIDGNNFDKRFILDFDIASDKINVNEKKFLTFDFYVRQNESNKKELKQLKSMMKYKVEAVVNNLVSLLNENNFIVAKRK